MERIQRAMELARLQRAAPGSPGPAPAAEPDLNANTASRLALDAVPLARTVALDRVALRERRVILPNDDHPAAHAYRMLRTQLLQMARTDKLRMIGVVSTADGEGKTLTAANLALSVAAEPNQTVLLADLDLRRPGVGKLLGIAADTGLDAWFDGSAADVSNLFVMLEGIERLRVLPTMRPVVGASEALAGARTKELLAELKNRYADRLVILDLPPVLLSDAVLTIAPLLDGVLLVVSEGRTRRDDVTRARELLGRVRILGTVLNTSGESEQRGY